MMCSLTVSVGWMRSLKIIYSIHGSFLLSLISISDNYYAPISHLYSLSSSGVITSATNINVPEV